MGKLPLVKTPLKHCVDTIGPISPPSSGGGGNVTDWDCRWFCVLIFCNYYECVLSTARKWKNVVAIFFCGPSVTLTQRQS